MEIEYYPAERMWVNILIKPFQLRVFRELRVELMNCPVEYEEESTCEDLEKTAGVSDTNGA